MELTALWKMFVRRWWLILIPPVIVLALNFQDFLRLPAGTFQATLHITAAQPLAGTEDTYEDAAYMPWIAAEQLIDALTMWARTTTFAEEVRLAAAADGLNLPPDALAGRMVADNTQMVMRLYITWEDAAELETIGRAAVRAMQEKNAAYFPSLADYPADVIALDEPVLTPIGAPLMVRFQPLILVGLALVFGLVLAAGVEYLDDSLHGREDVEALDIAVLGEIPRHRGSFKY